MEFEEDVDDKKAELHEITERGMMELERAVAHTTDQVRHDLDDERENIVSDTSDQVKRAVEDEEQKIVRQVGWPGGCVERVMRAVRRGKGGCRAVGRRERTSDEPLDVWQARNCRARLPL